MSSSSLDQRVAAMGENFDEHVILAALHQVPEEHRQLGLNAWKRYHRKVNETNARRSKILKAVQEALSQLRLDMKYLVFDLEATKRERDALRNKYNDFDDHPGNSC